MKKTIVFILILILIFSLGEVAHAVVITSGSSSGGNPAAPSGGSGIMICSVINDSVKTVIPDSAVIKVSVADAQTKLQKADREAFLNAYNYAKDLENNGLGRTVIDAYWFTFSNQYKLDSGNYVKFIFSSAAPEVGVTVNGHPMEVVSITGRTSYYAKLTELGTVLILSGPEPDIPEEEVMIETEIPQQSTGQLFIDS